MALVDSVVKEHPNSWLMCLLVALFALTRSVDTGVTQRHHQQQQRNVDNVSRVIEDLLETYDIRLRPRFGGRLPPPTHAEADVGLFSMFGRACRTLQPRECRPAARGVARNLIWVGIYTDIPPSLRP